MGGGAGSGFEGSGAGVEEVDYRVLAGEEVGDAVVEEGWGAVEVEAGA